MSALIEELKGEHGALKSLLLMIQEEKMDHEDQVTMIQTTKAKLLGHLQKEDEKLYPFLHVAAENDPVLAHKLKMFEDNMHHVTSKALDFYAKYENGWQRKERFMFRMDFAEVLALLAQRISIEEAQLYPEYDARQANAEHRSHVSMLGKLKKLFGLV